VSRENAEVVRRAIEAFNRRDLEALVETYDTDVVVDWSRSAGVEAGIYRGHEGVGRLNSSFYEAWDRITVSPEEFIERGEHVVVPNHACFWGRDGIKVEARSVFVHTIRDGRIVELRLFRERPEALNAVGMEEYAVSGGNVELHRRAIEVFNRRDLDGFLALADPNVEFTPYERPMDEVGPYRGHADIRVWWATALEAFPDAAVRLDAVRGFGEITIASGRLHGTGAGSGAPFDWPWCTAAKWRDEKSVWWYAYGSEDEALKAVGLI
jgi:ketosteroid isomerase-like protein